MKTINPMYSLDSIPAGTLLMEFLGQAGFWIRGDNVSVLIDPYLSNFVVDSGIGGEEFFHREYPPPEDPHTIEGIDLVFITHDHADHCDPQTILPIFQSNPQAKIICTPSSAKTLVRAGIPFSSVILPDLDVKTKIGELEYIAIPSAHYSREMDIATKKEQYLGFVLKINGVTLYHSGDTILFPGLIEILKKASNEYDLVCLPVNGRDSRRERLGFIGNLDAAEALDLAQKLSARVLLPMHNDLFASNRMDPGILATLAWKKAPGQRIHCLQPGEKYWYVK